MTWHKCIKIINELEKNLEDIDKATLNWMELQSEINSEDHIVPYHVKKIISLLNLKNNSYILDHGCGNGKTLIYLLARGFLNIKGVDVSKNGLKYNNFLLKLLNLNDPVFFSYQGNELPFKNNYFDFIYSQQVLEHVEDSYIDDFFTEENRVLKLEGITYHQIPHLLVPYESHVKIWFAHWLPLFLHNFIYRMNNIDINYFHKNIFLRSSYFFLKKLRSNIGFTKNISKERFLDHNEISYYDGNIFLRKLIQKLFLIPLIGKILLNMLVIFTMLETVSIKKI